MAKAAPAAASASTAWKSDQNDDAPSALAEEGKCPLMITTVTTFPQSCQTIVRASLQLPPVGDNREEN